MSRTRTPSELKWVLSERAAVAGELQSIDAELGRLVARRSYLKRLHAALNDVYTQLAPALPTMAVPVVNARLRYGGQGNCISWVRDTLRAAYPHAVDTAALTTAAAKTFGLDLASAQQRNQFRRNSLRSGLRRLLALGEAERLHDFQGVPHLAGVWRWVPREASFEALVAEAREVEGD